MKYYFLSVCLILLISCEDSQVDPNPNPYPNLDLEPGGELSLITIADFSYMKAIPDQLYVLITATDSNNVVLEKKIPIDAIDGFEYYIDVSS